VLLYEISNECFLLVENVKNTSSGVDFFQLEIYFSIPREIVLRSFIYVDLLRHTSSVTSRHGQLHKPLPWIQALQTGLDVINLLFFFSGASHIQTKVAGWPKVPICIHGGPWNGKCWYVLCPCQIFYGHLDFL
jgi:hypothetical protein